MLVVYGIKSCDTCRRALKFLKERGMDHEFHDVRADGLNIQMLERWADEVEWEKLLNRKSLTWRKIPETDKGGLNRNKALALILDNPTLMKRPIFETEGFFALGFSEKRFASFLDQKIG
ncbi:MAG: Spx/MgsR family RNA polymerase-binding regulatory protein [Pseudomonadota bacterium]